MGKLGCKYLAEMDFKNITTLNIGIYFKIKLIIPLATKAARNFQRPAGVSSKP